LSIVRSTQAVPGYLVIVVIWIGTGICADASSPVKNIAAASPRKIFVIVVFILVVSSRTDQNYPCLELLYRSIVVEDHGAVKMNRGFAG
jgi:hypothetical protein